jgi:hypothetical protein
MENSWNTISPMYFTFKDPNYKRTLTFEFKPITRLIANQSAYLYYCRYGKWFERTLHQRPVLVETQFFSKGMFITNSNVKDDINHDQLFALQLYRLHVTLIEEEKTK